MDWDKSVPATGGDLANNLDICDIVIYVVAIVKYKRKYLGQFKDAHPSPPSL
jgi:hypothetical protein